MKVIVPRMVLLAAACLAAPAGFAAELNLAALSCDKYENEIVGSPDAPRDPHGAEPAAPRPDPIDTVMWLSGFSVAKAGDRVMYGDALASVGFALDAQCRSRPRSTLLQALAEVKLKRDEPMDLTRLNCGTFESRHAQSAKSDPESANTIMMWLFGFSVGLSGGHVFDADGVGRFAAALQAECSRHPNGSLFDVLAAVSRGGTR